MKFAVGFVQRVEGPQAVLADAHEPNFAKVRQVPRCRGLWLAKKPDEIANAKLAVEEQMEDAQARRIRKRPEQSFDPMVGR